MPPSLVINEIYLSIQGESSHAGWPCIFIRLTGCDLRCSYCDTAYAFTEGTRRLLPEILERVEHLAAPFKDRIADAPRLPLVELTGGEPLLQKNALGLMGELCDRSFVTLLETSGAHDISAVDPRVHRIVDVKCPSSGEAARNLWSNLGHLTRGDEVKFVIATREDYSWAQDQLMRHRIHERCPVVFSWAAPLLPHQVVSTLKPSPAPEAALSRQELVEQLIHDALPVRFQLQMHKFIWAPDARAV